MLTIDELQLFSEGAFANEFRSVIGRSVNWHELFSILDHDGDGKISFHEFVAGASDKATMLNDDSLNKAFNLLDQNGDGYLDVDELKWRFSYFNRDGIVSEL